MFLDPLSGRVIDYVGGQDDLKAGLLRAIGDPAARFAEDKLRLVRAVRFAARFGFRIESETRRALVAMAPQVTVVAVERIAQELRRMLQHRTRPVAMEMLMEVGLADAILPELVPLKGTPADLPHRPDQDLWEHSLAVLDALPSETSFPLALAALLHETGRSPEIASRSPNAAEEVRSANVVEGVASRLKLSNADRHRAAWLTAHHRDLLEPRSLPVARLKRLLANPEIDELLTLHRADAEASGDSTDHVTYCERYRIEQPDGPIRPNPFVSGHDLKRLGLPPGPAFKQWLERAYNAQLEGAFQSRDEAIAWVARAFESNASPPRNGDGTGAT